MSILSNNTATTSSNNTAVSAAAANASATTASADATKFSKDYTLFLTMLTTQLKNQDPTQPTDSNQFTQQLVQFSNVEQQIKANDKLQKLVDSQGTSGASAALGYLGKTVDANGDKIVLDSTGEAPYKFLADKAYQKVEVSILDSKGKEIRKVEAPKSKGLQQLTWDGRDNDNKRAPAGIYSLKVVGTDSIGAKTDLSTIISGTVSSVGTENGAPMLTVNGIPLSIDKIISIRDAATAA
jgi:flagellar basal-body rod modification protein FlgD